MPLGIKCTFPLCFFTGCLGAFYPEHTLEPKSTFISWVKDVLRKRYHAVLFLKLFLLIPVYPPSAWTGDCRVCSVQQGCWEMCAGKGKTRRSHPTDTKPVRRKSPRGSWIPPVKLGRNLTAAFLNVAACKRSCDVLWRRGLRAGVMHVCGRTEAAEIIRETLKFLPCSITYIHTHVYTQTVLLWTEERLTWLWVPRSLPFTCFPLFHCSLTAYSMRQVEIFLLSVLSFLQPGCFSQPLKLTPVFSPCFHFAQIHLSKFQFCCL